MEDWPVHEDEQQPNQEHEPQPALAGYQEEFRCQYEAARARQQKRQERMVHPWLQGTKQQTSPEDKSQASAPDNLSSASKDRRKIAAVGAVFVIVCILLLSNVVWQLRGRSLTVAVVDPEPPTLTLWHDGSAWEHQQLSELGQVFSQTKEVPVVIETKVDLWGDLIRTVILQKPPALAIVSREVADRLLAAKALTPFNKQHISSTTTDTELVPSDAYFFHLAPQKPWARSQILVVPRTLQPSELALQLAEFIMQSIN